MYWIAFVSALVLVGACAKTQTEIIKIPAEVQQAIKVDPALYPNESAFVAEEVHNCGPGVVKGVQGENRCEHSIDPDDLFGRKRLSNTGYLFDEEFPYKDGASFLQADDVTLPDSFDLRDLMKGGTPPIKDQVNNDCWANASTSGLEVARAVHDGKPYQHSTQTMISCSGEGTAASGGYMTATDILKTMGLPLESDWPYVGRDLKCKYSASEKSTGWQPRALGTPYIGSSLAHSRFFRGGFGEGTKVKNMKQAMYQWKSGIVVTEAAYSISGDGVYRSCSAINSGGNHMTVAIGWDSDGGTTNFHNLNSWGKGHGKDGVSRIQAECGDGKLNRGFGKAAKIVMYKTPCTPPAPPAMKPEYLILSGSAVKLGADLGPDVACTWAPLDGVDKPFNCETWVAPKKSTEYHVTVRSQNCGSASAMTLIRVFSEGRESETILTPHGEIER